jgi:hypothetical protein
MPRTPRTSRQERPPDPPPSRSSVQEQRTHQVPGPRGKKRFFTPCLIFSPSRPQHLRMEDVLSSDFAD